VAQPTNRSSYGFEAQTKKSSRWCWYSNYQTIAINFEAQTGKSKATDFKAKQGETVATGFEAKLGETVPMDLRPNQETRAPCLLLYGANRTQRHPTCAWLSPILCIRSATPATILIAARHAAPATRAPLDKQTRFSTWNKDIGKTTEMSEIQI
jgi:hypothetical protein